MHTSLILRGMKVIGDIAEFPSAARGGVLSVGNFDGVHLGHQQMLSAASAIARREGCPLVILTFDPHPLAVIKPEIKRAPLLTLSQRLDLLAGFSPDVLVVQQANAAFLGMSADNFLRHIVRDTFAARWMVEGPNFTFGHRAQGTVQTLIERGQEFHIQPTIVATAAAALSDLTLVDVSSSLIRWLIAQGRVRDAAITLGRPYAIRGRVEQGAARGRTIGWPTANIHTYQAIPAAGVYSGWGILGAKRYPAAISIGNNPTFDGAASTLEAHLLDFSGDIYGHELDLQFFRWLRDQQKFASVEALKRQIEFDVARVRQAVQSQPLPTAADHPGPIPHQPAPAGAIAKEHAS